MKRVPASLAVLLLHQEADVSGDERLRIRPATLRKWVERGHITRGDGGYDLAEILGYLEQRERSTSVNDLITWLKAQIDEDERIGGAATAGPWWHNPAKQWLGPEDFERYNLTKGEEFVGYGGPSPFTGCIAATGKPSDREAMANAAHIARFDPKRMLDEVEAKREIINVCAAELGGSGAPSAVGNAELILHLMGVPYSDRPGYREEWRP